MVTVNSLGLSKGGAVPRGAAERLAVCGRGKAGPSRPPEPSQLEDPLHTQASQVLNSLSLKTKLFPDSHSFLFSQNNILGRPEQSTEPPEGRGETACRR